MSQTLKTLPSIDMQKQKIKTLFEKLKEANEVYVKCSVEKQNQLISAFQPIFDQLEVLGVDQGFSIGLLMGGREFLQSVIDQAHKPKEHEPKQQSII